MKNSLVFMLLLVSAASQGQNATVHFFYGSPKILGSEIMFHLRGTESSYLGGGFSGALEQNRVERPLSKDEKWCSIYAVGSLGFFKSILVKGKGGLAVYTGKNSYKEVLYKPLVGIGAMYGITKDVGIEIGYDTFNNGTIGFTVLF
jgi:hypothetical protein